MPMVRFVVSTFPGYSAGEVATFNERETENLIAQGTVEFVEMAKKEEPKKGEVRTTAMGSPKK